MKNELDIAKGTRIKLAWKEEHIMELATEVMTMTQIHHRWLQTSKYWECKAGIVKVQSYVHGRIVQNHQVSIAGRVESKLEVNNIEEAVPNGIKKHFQGKNKNNKKKKGQKSKKQSGNKGVQQVRGKSKGSVNKDDMDKDDEAVKQKKQNNEADKCRTIMDSKGWKEVESKKRAKTNKAGKYKEEMVYLMQLDINEEIKGKAIVQRLNPKEKCKWTRAKYDLFFEYCSPK